MTPEVLARAPRSGGRDRLHGILERHGALTRMSHHEVLGVEPGADRATIRAAFQQIVLRAHPDAHRSAAFGSAKEAEAVLIRATEAYRALTELDQGGGGWNQVRRPAGAPRPPRPTSPPPLRASARPVATAPPAPRSLQRKARPVEEVLHDATECLARGNAEGAVTLLHGVVARAKIEERPRVRRLLARAYVQEPRWRRYAVAQLRNLVEESPDDAEALALLGVLYHRDGLLARAESVLQRALHADPGQPDARAALQRVRKDRLKTEASDGLTDRKRPGLLARLLARAS